MSKTTRTTVAKKKRRRVKVDNDDTIQLSQDRVHKPKKVRPHIAAEFQERGVSELAEEASRKLLPQVKHQARGLLGTAVHKGWATGGRVAFRIKGQED